MAIILELGITIIADLPLVVSLVFIDNEIRRDLYFRFPITPLL